MATRKQRKRKQRHRRDQKRGAFQSRMRSVLDPNAPSALVLRQLWVSPEAIGLRDEYRQRIMDGYPYAADPDTDEPPSGLIDAAAGWPYLEKIHDFFVGQVQEFVSDRGSAEWLWWLRRLRGQFDDVNDIPSTGPYIEGVAEALSAGVSRPSIPLPDHPTFEFPFTPEMLLDLTWLREISIMMYRLHATMKRCAKGQRVDLTPGEIPRWEPDDQLDDAIEEYDRRSEQEGSNLLTAVGVVGGRTVKPDLGRLRIGGLVPHWYGVGVERPPAFDKADPLPFLFSWIDLDAIKPLHEQAILTETHVALILLLWAAFNIGTREPEHSLRRMTTPVQWGYMVTPTNSFLVPALDEMCEWMTEGAGHAMKGCWRPQSAAEVLEILHAIRPEVWPPLCGCPVHEAGSHSAIDLVGASRRLFATLLRPADGTDVNVWSAHFESDVQAIIDQSPWRPPEQVRPLIGRTVRRANGTALTDIDALGFNDGRILLISCKSIAFTVPALRGEFAVTRNIKEKIESAASDWDEVTKILQDDRTLLGAGVSQEILIDGCVVFPSTPFYTDPRWRRSVFNVFSYLISVSELSTCLG
jgi:hypothetical protein